MKKISIALILLCVMNSAFAQGKYAGPVLKKLIGKKYTDSRTINSFKAYTYMQGSMVNSIDDPETFTVDVFRKGTTQVVMFSLLTDSAANEYTILDVLEVKNIQKGWEIKTGLCSQNGNENAEIMALAKPGRQEIIKTIKQAWRCNRDKRRIELLPVKSITCINEGAEQY